VYIFDPLRAKELVLGLAIPALNTIGVFIKQYFDALLSSIKKPVENNETETL